MNKQFEVISIEDYGVVVAKNEPLKKGDLFWHTQDQKLVNAWVDFPETKYFYKVIATINKRIDGIPLIEIGKKDELLSFLEAQKRGEPEGSAFYNGINKLITGYKAANKGYSEEDIVLYSKWQTELMLDENKRQWLIDKTDKELVKEFLKPLQPKLPKSVVLETERVHSSEIFLPDRTTKKENAEELYNIFMLKITNPSTNTIIPISYEKDESI